MEKDIYGWWQRMNSLLIGLIIGCTLSWGITIGSILYERREQRKLLMHLEEMIDLAIKGEYVESHFDESELSVVEAKMSQYLAGQEMKAKALQVERDKIKALIADISHQTKTPIANISLYTQLLDEQQLPKESKACTGLLMRQTEKLQFLIEALVKSSRLETGIITINKKKQPVKLLIMKVIESAMAKAEEKEITLNFKGAEESEIEGLEAFYDMKWTTEALYNLVDNAVKYSVAHSKVEITVQAYELFVRIDVIDHGRGMNEEEIPKIFQRFYRSQAVSEMEGVGIGLYLARQIIASEGGYIKVRSTPQKGSTFSVFLEKA